MGTEEFWNLIAAARRALDQGADAAEIAAKATELLAGLPPDDIAAYEPPLAELMTSSYSQELWAAAYIVRGGASDDGFDYFRGWLIAQGREVFERAVADPDSLADHPTIIEGVEEGEADAEGEDILHFVNDAYRAATGEYLPPNRSSFSLPPLSDDWDFDDEDQMREHLPRLTALYYDQG